MPVNINKSDVIFLIRAYNEATRIWSVIDEVMAHGYRKILVVNDGSRDHTEEVVRAYPNVIYIAHPQNRWAGAALETGFEFLRRNAEAIEVRYVVTFDADGQHSIDDMPKFLEAFAQNPDLDIVFGSRFITKTESNVPFFRRIILWGGKWFTWAISGIRLTDAHNGYRMHSISAIRQITLTMDGMEYASEIIEQVRIHHLKFSEVPVNILYDDYTMAKGQRHGGAIRIAVMIIWKKFFS